MKIDGVDIKKCQTSILLRNYKMYLAMVPVYFLFSLFFVAAIVTSVVIQSEANMWPMTLCGVAGASVFAYIAISFIKKAKCIKTEINSRKVTEEEITIAKNSFNNLLKITVGATIAAIIIIALIAFSGAGGGNGSGGSTTCPNCGTSYRSDHPAADFIRNSGHCSACQGR